MLSDGTGGEEEVCRHLWVREARRDEAEDFDFAGGEARRIDGSGLLRRRQPGSEGSGARKGGLGAERFADCPDVINERVGSLGLSCRGAQRRRREQSQRPLVGRGAGVGQAER